MITGKGGKIIIAFQSTGWNVPASNARWKGGKVCPYKTHFPPTGFHFPPGIFTLAKPQKLESGKGGKVEVAFHLERMK